MSLALEKVQCARCGLVRNGTAWSDNALAQHYERDYALGVHADTAEPRFFTETGPVPRRQAIAEWIVAAVAEAKRAPPLSVGEVGCGEGAVLGHCGARWPQATLVGVEPNATAAGRGGHEPRFRPRIMVDSPGYPLVPPQVLSARCPPPPTGAPR